MRCTSGEGRRLTLRDEATLEVPVLGEEQELRVHQLVHVGVDVPHAEGRISREDHDKHRPHHREEVGEVLSHVQPVRGENRPHREGEGEQERSEDEKHHQHVICEHLLDDDHVDTGLPRRDEEVGDHDGA